MEPIRSIWNLILSGLVLALSIGLPVLVVLFVIRVARNSVTPQQREIQRLLAEAVELLKENNRLLKGWSENSSPGENPPGLSS